MNRYIDQLFNTPPRFYLHSAKYKLAKKEHSENYNLIKPCVFCLSTGRVGSETIARMFEQKRGIISVHEPLPKLFGLSRTAYNLSEALFDSNVETALVEAFLTGRRDLLNYALYTNQGYIETAPHVTFTAPLILKVIPDTKFIHLIRNLKDVVTSGVRRNWYAGHVNDKWRITPKPGSRFQKKWFEYSQVEKIIWLWSETNQWIFNFSQTINPNQYLLVYSEDIFASKADILISLFTFIGLDSPDQKKIERILRKQINAQRTGAFYAQEDWLNKVDPELLDFANQVIAQTTYIPN